MSIELRLQVYDSHYAIKPGHSSTKDRGGGVFTKRDFIVIDSRSGVQIQVTSRAEFDRLITAHLESLEADND
jgi:hypothetical protein